jgi:putative ABC transport system substrate-binding protein
MKRREFIALIGSAVATWPFAARAQQAGKVPTIGFLGTTTASAWGPWTAAFVQRLRELGWIEGRNLAIEYRWADGRTGRFTEIAAEFVRLKVDVIVTGGLSAVAVKQATSVIPIVFAVAADPVGTGLVASLGDRVAMSPACRPRPPILSASAWNSCARPSLSCAGWRSWQILATPPP